MTEAEEVAAIVTKHAKEIFAEVDKYLGDSKMQLDKVSMSLTLYGFKYKTFSYTRQIYEQTKETP